MTFCDWLLLLTKVFSKFILVGSCVSTSCLFMTEDSCILMLSLERRELIVREGQGLAQVVQLCGRACLPACK